jgi:hypothetical protein
MSARKLQSWNSLQHVFRSIILPPSPSMAPLFTREEDHLLLVIRSTLEMHRYGTWERTTTVYNIFVHSDYRRTQDSLKGRYRVIIKDPTKMGDYRKTHSSVLKKHVECVFQEVLDVSVYGAGELKLISKKDLDNHAHPASQGAATRVPVKHHQYRHEPFVPCMNHFQDLSSLKEDQIHHQVEMARAMVSQGFGRVSHCSTSSDAEADNIACLTLEIITQLDMLKSEMLGLAKRE